MRLSIRSRAGVPYIQAEVADAIYAELYLDGEPVKTLEEMTADPRLIEALERWRAGEDPVHQAEIAAEEEADEIRDKLWSIRVAEAHRLKDEEGIPFEEAYVRLFGEGP